MAATMEPITQIWVGVAVIAAGAVAVWAIKKVGRGVAWMTEVLAESIASRLIHAINGQLGLTELRDEVGEVKEDVAEIKADVGKIKDHVGMVDNE